MGKGVLPGIYPREMKLMFLQTLHMTFTAALCTAPRSWEQPLALRRRVRYWRCPVSGEPLRSENGWAVGPCDPCMPLQRIRLRIPPKGRMLLDSIYNEKPEGQRRDQWLPGVAAGRAALGRLCGAMFCILTASSPLSGLWNSTVVLQDVTPLETGAGVHGMPLHYFSQLHVNP